MMLCEEISGREDIQAGRAAVVLDKDTSALK